MIPSKVDTKIWRGTSFDLEIISQTKDYVYNPDTHIAPADLKRSHKQNLDHYGFVYKYIDFATLYTTAEFIVYKPWVKAGITEQTPLMSLTLLNGDIALTSRSVRVSMLPTATDALSYDFGAYKLFLGKANGTVDLLVYGDIEVMGNNE